MGIQKNVASILQLYMAEKHKTFAEFSDELQIARSSLQLYLKGEGNPTIQTIEQMAEKMEMDPAILLTGMLDLDKREIAYTLLTTLQKVGALPKEKQLRFVDLFLQMLQLWNEDEPNQKEDAP